MPANIFGLAVSPGNSCRSRYPAASSERTMMVSPDSTVTAGWCAAEKTFTVFCGVGSTRYKAIADHSPERVRDSTVPAAAPAMSAWRCTLWRVADEQVTEPDHTAVRVALWRAMHVRVDAPPHVLEDEVGLRLAAPENGWQERPDMDPVFTSGFRASIVGRARFIEDLVADRARHGTGQYVLLGAGLDTFAQRRADLASRLMVFEVDQPGTQAWKRRRLVDLGYGVPEWLRLVPVDFEEGASWQDEVVQAGFDPARPAVVA